MYLYIHSLNATGLFRFDEHDQTIGVWTPSLICKYSLSLSVSLTG